MRRLARGAKLAVASEARSTTEVCIRHLVATRELERRQRWLTVTAVAAATEVCGGSS